MWTEFQALEIKIIVTDGSKKVDFSVNCEVIFPETKGNVNVELLQKELEMNYIYFKMSEGTRRLTHLHQTCNLSNKSN